MDISILIPTYNRSSYISATIDAMQSWRALLKDRGIKSELIVGDNCSSDGTGDIVRGKNDLRYYVNERNLGITGNIMKGLLLCGGQYVWIFGDDDLFNEHAVADVFVCALEKSADAVVMASLPFFDGLKCMFSDVWRRPEVRSVSSIDVVNWDAHMGLISANIVKRSSYVRAFSSLCEQGWVDNAYVNKIALANVWSGGLVCFSEDFMIYQRVTHGSHFSRDPDYSVKVFVLDQLCAYDCYAKWWPGAASILKWRLVCGCRFYAIRGVALGSESRSLLSRSLRSLNGMGWFIILVYALVPRLVARLVYEFYLRIKTR